MGAIVSTSFPRSASRFAASLFTTLYGPENYVEGYCKLHLLNRNNAFTVVRKPEEAVVSWVSAVENHFDGFAGFTKDNVVAESVPFYIDWMNAIYNRLGKIYVTTFETFTNDTQNELNKISVHFDLPQVTYVASEITVDPRHVPGGNPTVEQATKVFDHPRWSEAVEAYQKVLTALSK